MSDDRDFKGVWIPKQIWLNKDLTLLEKIVFTEIDSLDNDNHCTAGNEYFAEFCNCSESKISKIISRLQELKMIEILGFDGRHRKIRVVKNTSQPSKIYKAASYNLLANNINNKRNNKSFISKDINNMSEVDWFIQNYHDICVSLPKVKAITNSRIKNIEKLFKKYDKKDILECFKNAEQSDFLKGNNDTGWKANIDFILREDKFINILEGKYGGSQNNNQTSTDMNYISERAKKGEHKGGTKY